MVGFVGQLRKGGGKTTKCLIVTVPRTIIEALNLKDKDYISCEDVEKINSYDAHSKRMDAHSKRVRR